MPYSTKPRRQALCLRQQVLLQIDLRRSWLLKWWVWHHQRESLLELYAQSDTVNIRPRP